jgi:hypothetical protein
MKKHTILIALLAQTALFGFLLCSCATYTTKQTDESKLDKQGFETRTITTTVKARTFFEARSTLANSATIQTDKSQSAKLGSLSQDATATNAVALAESIAKGATKGALEAITK